MLRLALAAAVALSVSACTSTNNTAASEPAKPGQPAKQEGTKGPGLLDKMEAEWKKEQAHFKQHGAAVLQYCRDDAHKLCSAVEKDPPKLVQCLKQNEGKLAPPCKNALAEYAKTHK